MANRWRPFAERFWAKMRKTDTCWLWTGPIFGGGGGGRGDAAPRGKISINGKTVNSSRAAYEFLVGPIPRGGLVLHRCGVSHCVNPDHLYLGTYADNARDRDTDGRTTRGDRHPDAKLSGADVLAIRSRYAAGGISYRAIGLEFGVAGPTVASIVRGETWKHLPLSATSSPESESREALAGAPSSRVYRSSDEFLASLENDENES